VWAGVYEKLFNSARSAISNIEGKQTGLLSRAMNSPAEEDRIPHQRITG